MMKRRWTANLLAGVILVATSGCAPEGAAERREAWVAFTDLEEQARDHWAAWALALAVAEKSDRVLHYAARSKGIAFAEEQQIQEQFPKEWEAVQASRAAMFAAQERLRAEVPDVWERWIEADEQFRRVDPIGWKNARYSWIQAQYPNLLLMADGPY